MPTTTGKATDFITFSRASLATVTDSDGRIKWAAHNLLTNSESFDWGGYAKFQCTIAANAVVAPDGATTADTMTSTGSGNIVYQSYSSVFTGRLTAGVFIKAGTNTSVKVGLSTGGNGYEATFTLTGSGTAGTPSIIGTGGAVTNITSAISALANGWYLCSLTYNDASQNNIFIAQTASSGTIHIWGAHLYRSDLGGMVLNPARGDAYYPTTPRNLLGHTSNFSSAAWNYSNSTFSSGLLTLTSTSGGAFQSRAIPTGGVYTLQCKIKKGTNNFAFLNVQGNPSNYVTAVFNLNAGTTGETAASGSGFAVTAHTISAADADGYHVCRMTFTSGLGSVVLVGFAAAATGNTLDVYGGPTGCTNGNTLFIKDIQLSDSASLDPYVANAFAAPTAAAYHGPRLDYDASTLAPKGLLVEEQRTNLLVRSEEFNETNWAKVNTTVSQNAALAPSGQTSAEKLVESSATSLHTLYQTVTTASAANTFSIYLKAAERSRVVLAMSDNTTGEASIGVDLSTGTTFASGIAVGSWTSASSTVTAVGNGWYRVALTATRGAGTQTLPTIYLVSSGATISYTGDGTSGVYLYGAQLEAGAFATSYIPTTSATVTRSVDVASVATSQFPYSATEGTIVGNFSWIGGSSINGGNRAAVTLREASNSNIYLYNGSSVASAWVVLGGVDQAYLTKNSVLSDVATKLGLAFATNDFAAAQDGGTVTTDTSGALPNPTLMGIGSNGVNSLFVSGHIRQITYIPRRLTNAELQARTL